MQLRKWSLSSAASAHFSFLGFCFDRNTHYHMHYPVDLLTFCLQPELLLIFSLPLLYN